MIIVTGTQLKKVGFEVVRAPYAREVSSIEDIKQDETVWSGVLKWIEADPEGRWSAGWSGPHGLIVEDQDNAGFVGQLKAEIRAAESAINIAENGYQGAIWRAATEAEIEAGLIALEKIDGLRAELAVLSVMHYDGTEYASELAKIRADKEAAELAARAASTEIDLNKTDWQVAKLVGCLRGDGGSCGVRDNGTFYVLPNYDRSREWSRSQLKEIPEIEAIKAIAANHQDSKVCDFFNF